MTTNFSTPSWRMPDPHSVGPVGEFHACGEGDRLLCEPFLSLFRSIAEPNESSPFCVKCMEIVRGQR